MISMSKEEMINYLRSYSTIVGSSFHHPDRSIGSTFNLYLSSNNIYLDNPEQYYDRMRHVYTSYNFLREFSIIEDFLLNRDDYLNNNDLNGLFNDATFYSNINGISNKKIIQFIRNAFNHNDDTDFDRFRMSVNGRFYEIELKDIRTQKEIDNGLPVKPFHMKISVNALCDIINYINDKRQNILVISFDIPEDFDINAENIYDELGKIKLVRYYFNRKVDNATIQSFDLISNQESKTTSEIDSRSDAMHNLAKSISDPVLFDLTHEQKEKVASMIEIYRRELPDLLVQRVEANLYYFLLRVVPVPLFKYKEFKNQMLLADSLFIDYNYNLSEVRKKVADLINGTAKVEDDPFYECLTNYSITDLINLYKDLLDGEFIQGLPIMTYIDSVITHYCDLEEITIDGVTYNKEKLRNSFVHSRWFFGTNGEVVFYDADPRNINDYNLDYIGKINVVSFKKWVDDYLYTKKDNFMKKKRG